MYHVLHHSNCLGSCSEQRSSLMELHPAHNTSGYKRSVYNSLVLWPSRCPPCRSHFYKERSVELSGCFSGQPPSAWDWRTSLIRRPTHLHPKSQSFLTSSRRRSPSCSCSSPTNRYGKGTNSERLNARVTDSNTFRGRISLLALCCTDGVWCWKVNSAMSPLGLRNTDRHGNCCCVAVGQWFSTCGLQRLMGQEGPSDRRGAEPCQIILRYSLPMTYRCTVFRFHRAEVCVCKLGHLKSFVKIHTSSIQARPVCN